MSNQQVGYFLVRKLWRIYDDFVQNLMADCELQRAFSPIRLEKPIYGTFDTPFRDYAAPGFVITYVTNMT